MNAKKLFLLFAVAFIVQTGHYIEHVAQVIQINMQGIPPADAHGLLGSAFDFEGVHFMYNVGLEIILIAIWLSYRAIRQTITSATLQQGILLFTGLVIFQGYHAIEHIIKMAQYLFVNQYQSGVVPTPGFLPTVTGWPIFIVHFWLNTIIWTGMLVVLWLLRSGPAEQTAALKQSRTSS